jgi:SpoVK/Ycf46/Vps4 family AAA+-type ATPase
VVSKYIGETEKNMRLVFDAAGNGKYILFFDEGDALFGKRSEVKDTHDRYANMQIDYFSQRMEDFPGIVILAVNQESSMDEGFAERFQSVIQFPLPTAK